MKPIIVDESDEQLVQRLVRLLPAEEAEAVRLVAGYRVQVRHDTLEETLQMVCTYCARGVPMDPAQPDSGHQANHSKGRGTSYPACRAAGIRALMKT